jgi:hypothetical protein
MASDSSSSKAALTAAGLPGVPAAATERARGRDRTRVGAIRWDAWVGDLPTFGNAGPNTVGQQVERALGPVHWHDRLPFFAREVNARAVEVRAITHEVMDREIDYARSAGLDYWAFVYYPPGSGVDTARQLYLASDQRSTLDFCLIFDDIRRFRAARDQGLLLEHFARPEHVRVLDGRPLLFVFARALASALSRPEPTGAEIETLRQEIDAFRASAVAAGVGNPYIACMGGHAPFTARVVAALGLDAGSAYAEFGRGGVPFAELAGAAERRWEEHREAGLRVIPWVTTGWDPRPRVEHPVSWTTYEPDWWAQPGTPEEIAAHLERALAWATAHPEAAETNTVLIYAWNEFDEGGWLCPLLREGTARLDAVRRVLMRR